MASVVYISGGLIGISVTVVDVVVTCPLSATSRWTVSTSTLGVLCEIYLGIGRRPMGVVCLVATGCIDTSGRIGPPDTTTGNIIICMCMMGMAVGTIHLSIVGCSSSIVITVGG